METRGTYPSGDIARFADGGNGSLPYARIVGVVPDSPAYDAGFESGCMLTSVDGQPIRDVIDWRWLASDEVITVGYIDLDGDEGTAELWRDPGEDWGFEFEGLVFDGVKQCRNACTFCFMRMLPRGMRPSLYLRDDDFRLSFLVGTFVTLTNLTADDEARIVEQRISPLRVSLQASNPDIRRKLIGKHAQHGIDALDRLLDAGIEVHAQIVLVPGANDGIVLEETLEWAYARQGIRGVGIVPLGYTRFQDAFDHSFNDRSASRAVLEAVEAFQRRAYEQRGSAWVYAADEFYRNAHPNDLLENLPPSRFYEGFEMFEDGIGIIRSTVDDWRASERSGIVREAAAVLRESGVCAVMVAGCAQREFLEPLVRESGIGDVFRPLFVENRYFGGNVDVTGLLVGEDIASAVREHASAIQSEAVYLIPRVVFNDDGVTLDGLDLEDMEKAAGQALHVVSCTPIEYFEQIIELASASIALKR